MAVPDVRVRLSAEGLKEVVDAFKKVQAEAEKAGRAGSLGARGLQSLSGALSGVASLLPTLTAAAAVAGLVALTKRSLETADALGKLAQKTGLSVETLSTLSFAARTADLDQEQLRVGLVKFTKTVDDYDQGVKSARQATQQLFGRQDALKGLTDDERLLKVVDALAKLEPGAKRTGVAIEFFGRQGAELLPLIDDLGQGGFDELRKKAEQLGLVIDSDLARAAQEANDAMTDLKSTVEGISLQFTAGFAPALADVGDALVAATTQDGVGGFRTLGDFAGRVLKLLVVGVTGVIGAFVELGGKASVLLLQPVRAAGLLIDVLTGKKGVLEASREFRDGFISDLGAVDAFVEERTAKILAALNIEQDPSIARTRGKRDRDRSKDLEADQRALQSKQKLADAQLKLQQAQLDAELALQKAKNALLLDDEKRRFDQGLVDLQTFFDERRRIIDQETDAELVILKQKVDAAQKRLQFEQTRPLAERETETDRRAKTLAIEADLAKLQADVDLKELERKGKLAELDAEQLNLQRQVTQEQLQAEAQLLAAQGQRFAAARKELEAQIAAMERLKGETEEAFEARKSTVFGAGLADINFDEIKTRAQQALNELDAGRQAILDKVLSGQLFQLQGEEQILKLERDRLPLLQQIAEAMRAAAITPEQIEAARQFQEQINQLAIHTDRGAQFTRELKQTFEQAAASGLADFLGDLENRVQSVGDAFRELGLAVAKEIQRMIAQMLAAIIVAQILKAVLGLFGGGGGASAPTPTTVPAGGVGVAEGGLLRGPGTATSDSIPAWLSDFEFVEPAATVRYYGPELFEALRRRRIPRDAFDHLGSSFELRPRVSAYRGFAEGGLVADGEVTAGAAPRNAALEATLGLDEGLVLKRLEATPEFKRVLVRLMQKHSKAFNAALGRLL